MVNRYIRILVMVGMVAVICGTAGAAGVGVIAETHVTSGAEYPACTAPCECMAESTAIAQWGVTGYEMCSKSICGQSADAMVQYHCIHQAGSTAAVTTTAPVQVPVASTAIPASPPAAATTQKSPAGIATSLAAIGAALLAGAPVIRK
jgi:hypothetical protein